MGGKALNSFGVFTERKNTVEFNRIGVELNKRIISDLSLLSSVITCYHTKPDHGDLDLLIQVPINSNINWGDYIRKTFNPNALNSNGGVYSFDYENFQIDFIPIPEPKWNTALTYFSYDPLGNIMGKTYHKFGLSYGWEGLIYKFRNFNGTNSANILLTNDPRKIFNLGGYDYDRYLSGFDTIEEIFDFCIDGDCFDSQMFKMENLKSIDRKRNHKRGSYRKFLKYIENNEINIKYAFHRDKDNYLEWIDSQFPEAKLFEKLNTFKIIDTENKIISQKFNGDIVMSWLPNLMGKQLGQAISKFKNELGDDYNQYILNASFKDIHERFMSIYNAYK